MSSAPPRSAVRSPPSPCGQEGLADESRRERGGKNGEKFRLSSGKAVQGSPAASAMPGLQTKYRDLPRQHRGNKANVNHIERDSSWNPITPSGFSQATCLQDLPDAESSSQRSVIGIPGSMEDNLK